MTDLHDIEEQADGELLKQQKLAQKEFERPEYVNRHPVPIILEGLSVKKDNASDDGDEDDGVQQLQTAPTVASALLGRWLATKLGLVKSPAKNREAGNPASSSAQPYVFENVNAVLLPGENTLLLGPSSSGKTSLMRAVVETIGNAPSKSSVEGKVWVNGTVDPTQRHDSRWKRTCAFVDQGDLSLTPVLTVEETVLFAYRCAEGKREFTQESLDAVLQLVGLDHVKNTVVGNSDIRGVSGGQKRRVKVLEMAVGRDMTLECLDEPTNGLDSASALKICQVLSVASKAMQTTAVVSLLQPSTEVYETFHRLILLTQDGKVAYSGKREDALRYFEDTLGFIKPDSMNVPEFLLRCTYAPEEFIDAEKQELEHPKGDDDVEVAVDEQVWKSSTARRPQRLSSSEDLAKAFEQSQAGKDLMDEIAQIKAEKSSSSEKQDFPDLPEFAISTCEQIRLLVGRGWKLVVRNPANMTRVITAIFFGVFIGTLFLHTGSDANGTSVRSGYILTLIYLTFLNSSMSPLEELFEDRMTFYIHRRAMFYRTSSYYVSKVLSSAPTALAEAFFLAVLSFFAIGMNNHGGWGFLYFWLDFSLISLSGTAISRILAYGLPTEDVAETLGCAALLFFILTTGMSPQYLELPIWLRWISWLSPCAYCYEGAIVNELFDRDVGNFNGTYYGQMALNIPRIPYEDAPVGLNTQGSLMAFDAYMMIALTLVFEVIGCILLHKSQDWYGPATKRYQVESGMSLSAPPSWTSKKKSAAKVRCSSSLSDGTKGIPIAPAAHLTSRTIVYEVDVPVEDEADTKKEEKKNKQDSSTLVFNEDDDDKFRNSNIDNYGQSGRGVMQERLLKRQIGADAVRESVALKPARPGRLRLLSGITASFEPGTLTALMGSSGAGKSTLLDVLAGYKTGGHITGDININGKPKTDKTWRSIAGYCEQVDLQNPALTVRESLIFAARMRLRPFSIPDDEKVKFVTNILSLLDLDEFADMLVGDESDGDGLPKHARKRLTVGVELAANPSILFADEPTSGLDSLSASVVVSSLKRAAKQEGLTIVCTIHQPSRGVFEAFDNLLLLQKGGICVYNGALSGLDAYMRSAPDGERFAMPKDANPADHVLDVFCGPLGEGIDWASLYETSDMAAKCKKSHDGCTCDACKSGEIAVDTTPQSFVSELYIEIQRELLVIWRTPAYMSTRFWWTVSANVIAGVIYRGSNDLTNLIGAMFFYISIATVPMFSAMVPLIHARSVFYREVASGTYRRVVYGVAVQVAELPFNILFAILSFVIFYFLVGLSMEGEKIGYFILMSCACYWMLPAFGQLFAFVTPNLGAAIGLGSLVLTLFQLTMGFFIPPDDIPPWYIWIYWINPLRYTLQGLVVNEVGGDLYGDLMLETVDWSYDQRWWYCYVAALLFAGVASIGILLSTRISWLKR